MAKGFFDVQQQEPYRTAGDALQKSAQAAQTWRQAQAEAAPIKEQIRQEIEAGQAPQLILYQALKVIGILTGDPEFTATTTAKLDTVYKDLEQQALFQNNEKIAQERLAAQQRETNERTRRSLLIQLSKQRKVESAIQEAIKALAEILDTDAAADNTTENQ